MKKFIIPLVMAAVVVSVMLAGCVPGAEPVTPPVEPVTPPVEPVTPPVEPVTPPVEPVTPPGPEPPYVDEWNLPSLGVLSGPFAAWGLEVQWVIDLAAEEINTAGGIRGTPVRIDWYDSAYDTAKAVQQMTRMLDTKPLVIAGVSFDAPQRAVLPMAASEGVFILDGDGGPAAFPEYAPWGVSLMPTIYQFTPAPVNYYLELHGDEIESLAIFINRVGTTHEPQANMWRDAFQARGITVHPYIECPSEMIDFRSAVLKAMGYGADAFLNIVVPEQAAKIDIELYKSGIEGWRIVNTLPTNAPPLYEIGEGYLEDTYTYALINPDLETEKWQTFRATYQEWRGDPKVQPTFATVYSYDVLYIIKEAFEAENITGDPAKLSEERIKIRDYINNLASYEGLQGEFSIANSTALKPITFLQVKDNIPVPMVTLPVE